MESSSHNMRTKATQAAVDAASLCVTMAAMAVLSAHRSATAAQ